MVKYTNPKIEKLGVNAVSNYIVESDYLSDFLALQSTEPATDGTIRIYNGPGECKRDLIGIVAAQVKGTTTKNIIKHNRHKIDIVDLSYYYKVGGVVYFVVYVINKVPKIYYRDLLRIDIKEILKKNEELRGKKEEGTITIDFREVPVNVEDFRTVLLNFHKDQDYQTKDYVELGSINEISNDLTFTIIAPNSNIVEALKYVSPVLYKNEGDLKIPVRRFKVGELSVFTKSEFSIGIKGANSYIATVMEGEEETEIQIGSLQQLIVKFKEGRFKVDFEAKGKIQETIELLEMLLGIVTGVNLYIDNKPVTEFFIEEVNEDFISRVNHALESFKKTQEALNHCKVPSNFHYEELTENDIDVINSIMELYQTSIDNTWGKFEFNNRLVYLLKHKGTIYNLLDSNVALEINFWSKHEDGIQYTTTPLILIDDFSKMNDTEICNIKGPIEKLIPIHEKACSDINLICVRLIDAYDQTNNNQFLLVAFELLELIIPFTTNNEIHLIYLNKYQIKKRWDNLAMEDINHLVSIQKEFEEDKRIHLATLILLRAKNDAAQLLSELKNNEGFSLEDMPILNLLEKN
ncbi:DUF4365 domain-containing protein [Listeria monocytogenes]|nr:DUF4365 domain-containing protein [Listeria monocytogenes]EHG1761786.1 DUF4365 domain-containing protein [Listeria monocytogenes]